MVAGEGSESALVSSTSIERTSDRELVLTRTFNGPARLVFEAWTRPELVRRWWAPAALGVTVVTCEADVRVGGTYRYELRTAAGHPVVFSGEYSEVTPYSRLVYTTVFEAMREAGATIVTVTFEEDGGRTHLESRELYPSKAALDGAMASGMEIGARATMDQLDELVLSLAPMS